MVIMTWDHTHTRCPCCLSLAPQCVSPPTPPHLIPLIWVLTRLMGIDVLFHSPPRARPPPWRLQGVFSWKWEHHVGPQRPHDDSLPFTTKPGAYTAHLPELEPLHTPGLTNSPLGQNESWRVQTASVNGSLTKGSQMHVRYKAVVQ